MKVAKKGDVLISVRAPIGAINIADRECCIGRGLAALSVNEKLCNRGYFELALLSKVEELISKGTGSTFKAINKQILQETEITLYDNDIQTKIAETLYKVNALIDKRKQQLENLDKLIKSQFIEMFGDPERNEMGWNIVPLSQIAEYFNGLTYRPEDRDDKGTIVLRSSNIQQGELDFSDIVRVQCRVKEKLFVKNGDILMCSRNGSANLVGKVAQIPQLSEPMTFGAFMMIIRSQVPEYLTTYFRLNTFRNQIKTGATTTINQITAAMLNKVRLPLPPRTITDKFARFVEQTDKSKFTIKQSLEQLEILKKSLMQKYFG